MESQCSNNFSPIDTQFPGSVNIAVQRAKCNLKIKTGGGSVGGAFAFQVQNIFEVQTMLPVQCLYFSKQESPPAVDHKRHTTCCTTTIPLS